MGGRSYNGICRGGVCVSDLWRRSYTAFAKEVFVSVLRIGVSCQSVLQKCQARVSSQSALQKCQVRGVLQKCQVRVFYKSVK